MIKVQDLQKFRSQLLHPRDKTVARKALITGLTGQDGSYLAEILVAKGYKVFGLVRRSSSDKSDRISHLSNDVQILSAIS